MLNFQIWLGHTDNVDISADACHFVWLNFSSLLLSMLELARALCMFWSCVHLSCNLFWLLSNKMHDILCTTGFKMFPSEYKLNKIIIFHVSMNVWEILTKLYSGF